MSLSKVPPAVSEEVNRSGSRCNFCSIISNEKKTARKCFENDSMIAFTPYASRFSYELWITPKKHLKRLSDFSEKEFTDFAGILSRALKKLKKLNVDYNYYLHYAPGKSDLHLHLELITRAEYPCRNRTRLRHRNKRRFAGRSRGILQKVKPALHLTLHPVQGKFFKNRQRCL